VIDSNDITKALCQATNGKAGCQYLLLTRVMISSFECQLIREPHQVANPDDFGFNAENTIGGYNQGYFEISNQTGSQCRHT
jgi:hypothetical protein